MDGQPGGVNRFWRGFEPHAPRGAPLAKAPAYGPRGSMSRGPRRGPSPGWSATRRAQRPAGYRSSCTPSRQRSGRPGAVGGRHPGAALAADRMPLVGAALRPPSAGPSPPRGERPGRRFGGGRARLRPRSTPPERCRALQALRREQRPLASRGVPLGRARGRRRSPPPGRQRHPPAGGCPRPPRRLLANAGRPSGHGRATRPGAPTRQPRPIPGHRPGQARQRHGGERRSTHRTESVGRTSATGRSRGRSRQRRRGAVGVPPARPPAPATAARATATSVTATRRLAPVRSCPVWVAWER